MNASDARTRSPPTRSLAAATRALVNEEMREEVGESPDPTDPPRAQPQHVPATPVPPTLATLVRHQAWDIVRAYHLSPRLVRGLSDVWSRALCQGLFRGWSRYPDDRFRNILCDASGVQMSTPNDREAAAMAQSAGSLLYQIMLLRGYVDDPWGERLADLHTIFYQALRGPSSELEFEG